MKLIERIDALVALLNENEILLSHYLEERSAIVNFVTLKENIFLDEFEAALQFLKEAIKHPQTFRQAFIEHCRERENKNRTHAQSFTSTDDSAANNLYCQVAITIFNPKTMSELLSLILPDIQYYINIDYSDDLQTKNDIKAIKPILSVQPITTLTSPLTTSKMLLDYTFTHNTAFYTGHCHRMYYDTLVQFYNSMNVLNQALCTRLFGHNPTFNKALLDLQQPTLKAAIEQLILKLRDSAQKSTAHTYATNLGGEAFKLFVRYWNLFDDNDKAMLSKLNGNAHHSLGEIITHLLKGDCVEEAYEWLQSILDNPGNQEKLLILPSINGSCYAKKKPYRFESAQQHDNQSFPSATLKHNLSTITISYCDDLLSLLFEFPSELYADLIGNAHFKFKLLENKYFITKISENIFSLAQEQALAQAITAHHQKFSSKNNTLKFAIKTKNDIFITAIATLFNNKSLSHLLSRTTKDYKTILQTLTNHPQAVAVFFKLFPSTRAYHETIRINNLQKNCFDYCYNPTSLSLLLSQAPTELDKYNAISRTISLANKSLLTQYTYHQGFIAALKASFKEQHYFWALIIQACIKYFFSTSINPTILQRISLYFHPLPTYTKVLTQAINDLIKNKYIKIFKSKILLFLTTHTDEDSAKFNESLLNCLCYAENIDNSLEALKASWAVGDEVELINEIFSRVDAVYH